MTPTYHLAIYYVSKVLYFFLESMATASGRTFSLLLLHIELLPKYRTPEADIYAIYPPQHQASARVREFVSLLQASFASGISAAPL